MLEGEAVAGGQGSTGLLLKPGGGRGPQLQAGGELCWWLRHAYTAGKCDASICACA